MITGIVATTDTPRIQKTLLNPPEHVAALEWRLDYLKDLKQDFTQLKTALQRCPIPVILTLRTQGQGGRFQGNAQAYKDALSWILAHQPAFFDIEHPFDKQHAHWLLAQSPKTHWIVSHHSQRPHFDVSEIFNTPLAKTACWFKLITQANHAIEALRWLIHIRPYRQQYPCIAHSTGPNASFSRLLGRAEGNPITYAALPHWPAPASGLIQADILSGRYHYHNITHDTPWFALIGDPIEHSQGDRFHNTFFQKQHHPGCYIKIPLPKKQLLDFFKTIVAFNIQGLSVTTPLKRAVCAICPQYTVYPTINTLRYHAKTQTWFATNTDVLAAEHWFKKHPTHTLLIIGAGDTAQAIIHHFSKQYPQIALMVVNRTAEKVTALTIKYPNIKPLSFQNPCPPVESIINTLPNTLEADTQLLTWLNRAQAPKLLNCDYQHGANTPLSEFWKNHDLSICCGLFFFQAQALEQQRYWSEKI